MSNLLIYDLGIEELNDWLSSQAEPNYRGLQVWQGLYKQCLELPEEFSSLSKKLRGSLTENFNFRGLKPEVTISANDGYTSKVLFTLADGANVESVLMRYEDRNTICISTQSGCAMNCSFCATGKMGFIRNLSSGEILSQVIYFERLLRKESLSVTNVVLMGMGEPFNNYDASIKAIYTLNDPNGFSLGIRRFTISTVGIIPRIRQFADEDHQINLAVSLHAASDELRTQLVPINRFYPIKNLIDACKYYVEKTHRRITFEYALIDDVNDSYDQAKALAALIKGILCHVNLIALNPTPNSDYRASSKEKVREFNQILADKNISSTVRLRRGIEIQAGCGQLAYQKSDML
jgi:23S rRNA (adenine2503-C2)-methyltransferase